jgi:hypothetical protein
MHVDNRRPWAGSPAGVAHTATTMTDVKTGITVLTAAPATSITVKLLRVGEWKIPHGCIVSARPQYPDVHRS